jgi:hypothetical protein
MSKKKKQVAGGVDHGTPTESMETVIVLLNLGQILAGFGA